MNELSKLELLDFSFSYGEEEPVISGVSVSLEVGDFVCLCGPNGAGKSTLLKALAGASGIRNAKVRAQNISVLFQNETPLWDYTVFDTVLSGRFCHTGPLGNYSRKDYEAAREAIKEFGLEPLSEKSVQEISGGEFQKVRLARSFAQGSRFLILDEPLSSLDFVASEKLMGLLKEKCREHNKAVIVSIHDINTAARFADRMILLGKAVKVSGETGNKTEQLCYTGTVQEVLTSENLSKVYGSPVKVFMHPETGIPQI